MTNAERPHSDRPEPRVRGRGGPLMSDGLKVACVEKGCNILNYNTSSPIRLCGEVVIK